MLKNIARGLVIAIIALATINSCDNSTGSNIEKEFDRTGQEIKIVVYVYPDLKELNKAFKEWLGDEFDKLPDGGATREGFSVWSRPGDDNLTCEIHTTDPRSIRDGNTMETWGHELVHCVYGRYHK